MYREDGLTLVEVMVAMVVLLVGVLGAVQMIDGASALTSRTKAREGGTALARSALEIARAVPYKDLTSARVIDELEDRPGMDDASGAAGHQVSSRGFTYTVTPAVCSMDDPRDNIGEHDEVGVAFCPDSDVLGAGQASADRNADDYRRVVVQLSWAADGSHTDSTKQTGVVTNPAGGLGPSVTSLTPDDPNTTALTTAEATPTYDVTTSAPAASVSWSVNGARLGEADETQAGWNFEWDLGDKEAPAFVDCTYVLQAEAFDEKGRAGARKALTVTLNRRQPFAPPAFAGGRNLDNDGGFHRVDLQWGANQECDVKEYRVYRGTSPVSVDTLVCARDVGEKAECVDQTAPPTEAGVTLYYQVVAVDEDANGVDREGDRSEPLQIDESNTGAPSTPTGFTVCTGGNPDCNDIEGEPAPSGAPVLSWDASSDPAPGTIAFYRVYRDGDAYADRLDILFPVPDKPLVFIDSTATGPHAYRVSAVDDLFGESQLSGEVTWP